MVLYDSEKSGRSLLLLPGCGFILSLLFLVLCTSLDIEAATFARDAKTELSVDPPGSPDASGIFGLVHFADSPGEEDFDFSGSLKLDGKLYRLEQPSEQKSDAVVVIDGDLEGEQLEVKTSGLTDWLKKQYDLSGTYRKLSNTELQQRAQLRYDAADTWLNEIYQLAKKKLAASSFADLKKREADWIAYRDYFADQSAGINAKVTTDDQHDLRGNVRQTQSLLSQPLDKCSIFSIMAEPIPNYYGWRGVKRQGVRRRHTEDLEKSLLPP